MRTWRAHPASGRQRTDPAGGESVLCSQPVPQSGGGIRHAHRDSLNQGTSIMNKNQVEGKAEDIVGKVQAEAGKLVGSHTQELKGLGKQVEGQTKKAVGDAQEAIKDASKKP